MELERIAGEELQIFGALLQGYAVACVNLNVVAGRQARALTTDIEIMRWYPFERLRSIERQVLQAYSNAEPILERVGIEMMSNWYHYGPGKEVIKSGIDFLHFQAGARGYSSVVQGPTALVGAFELIELDARNGTAKIHTTTPLNRESERGVIIGGMLAPGDIDYIDVYSTDDKNILHIEFH